MLCYLRSSITVKNNPSSNFNFYFGRHLFTKRILLEKNLRLSNNIFLSLLNVETPLSICEKATCNN